MDVNKINISKVETHLNSIFDNTVSDNTFFGEMVGGELIDSSWDDMVLIEVPTGIEDMDAYGKGTVLVWLYAKPLLSGRKNVNVMSKLEQRLNNVLANHSNTDGFYIKRRLTYTDYDSNIKWHCNIVELQITIV